MEQPLGCGHRHQAADLPTAARLPEDRHVLRVAAEAGDVVANPLEDGHEVEQADIRRVPVLFAPQLAEIQVAEGVEAMIVRDDDRVVSAGQVLAVVREEVVARATQECPTVHPNQYRPAGGAVDLGRPDVDPKAVFTLRSRVRAAVEQERVFVAKDRACCIGEEVADRADRPEMQRDSDAFPGLRLPGRLKSRGPAGRRAVWNALEGEDGVADVPPNFTRSRLHDRRGVRRYDGRPRGWRIVLNPG
jgi:hypothetical protein